MSVANNDILKRLGKARTSHRQFSSLHDSKGTDLVSKHRVSSQNKVGVTTKNARLLEVNYNSKSLQTNAGLQTGSAINTSKLLLRDNTPILNEKYSKQFNDQSSLIGAKLPPNVSQEKPESKIHSSAKYRVKKVDLSTKFHQNTQSSKTSQSSVISTFAVPNIRRDQKFTQSSSLNLSQNLIPDITPLTSSKSISLGHNISSILSQHYCYPQANIFTWVKYNIPNPPPNLEVVERKLYPHRFKIKIEEISLFIRIPTPPPHMPEAIRFPLQELIPAPPPDIPLHLLVEVPPQKIRIKTDRTPNPIMSIIPAPPPDIPYYLIGKILSHQLIIKTDRTPNPIMSIIPAPPSDIPYYLIGKILSHQLIIKTDRTPNPIISIIPAPPPDIPLHLLREVTPKKIRLKTDRTPNPMIPAPPPGLPVVCGDSFDSSDSWDSFEDPAELHALHLQEIVRAAELREKENKTKYQKAKLSQPNFHQLHLEEIIKTALESEKENKAKYQKAKLSQPNFHQLHLEEIIKTALERENENKTKYQKAKLSQPNFHQLHLEEIIKTALEREKENKAKYQKAKLSQPNFHQLHLEEIIKTALEREEENKTKYQKAKLSQPNFHQLHLEEIIKTALESEKENKAKYQKAKLSQPNFHQLHLEEIIKTALEREEENKAKYQKAKLSQPNFHQLHLEEIIKTSLERENENKTKYQKAKLSQPNFHQLHLEEIIKTALEREKENKTKYQKAKLSQPNFHQLHLEEIIKTALESEKENKAKYQKAKLSQPNFHQLHLEEIIKTSLEREKENETKYQKAKLSQPNFHQLHLEEIIKTALEREEENKTKYQKAKLSQPNFHQLHLEEIIKTALERENENKTRYQKAKLSQPNFHQLHLEEIIKTALEREKENIARLKSKETIKETKQQSSPRQGLLAQLSQKIHFLTELENTLQTACPVRPSLIKQQKPLTFSCYPDLTLAYNHMSQHLTPKMYDRLSQVRTESGFRIDQAIQTGIDNPGDLYSIDVGCVAGDEDSYSTFAELFDLVIYSSHHGYSTDRIHCTDLDPVSITDGYFDPNFVSSCRVLGGRSIRGFTFLPHCTLAERRGVESVVKECICSMPHPYKGSYYSLKEIDLGEHEYLRKRRFLFTKPVCPSVVAARMTRNWPDARGLWLNRDENFMAWVNEEDHVRLISMEEGGDLKSVFERFCLGVQLFEMTVLLRGYSVMKNEHIGYILTCPSNLGTGMVITLSVRLPMLLAYPGLRIILEYLRLEKRGAVNKETGEFDISNTDRLGITEVEITQSLIHSVQLLIRMERTLWSGLCLQELLREIYNTELANLLLVGMYHKDHIKRIMRPKYFIPRPPPDICI